MGGGTAAGGGYGNADGGCAVAGIGEGSGISRPGISAGARGAGASATGGGCAGATGSTHVPSEHTKSPIHSSSGYKQQGCPKSPHDGVGESIGVGAGVGAAVGGVI